MKEKILKIAVKQWNKNLGGISALFIAEDISVSHQEVLECFNTLSAEGKGTLRENVTLDQFSIKYDGNSYGDMKEEGEVLTTIFFPSKQILKQQFEMENKNYGTFLNRLHLGNSRIELYYFDSEVLSTYFNHVERYDIIDNVIGGYILTNSEYYLSLPEDKRDENTFAVIRYGRRKLVNGSFAIATTLYDLSELPLKEQKHWEYHEIDDPIFLEIDYNFGKHIQQNFAAEFIDNGDPLIKIIEKIEYINSLFNGVNLFKNVKNDYLKYPVINTEKVYCDVHTELYKLISADSLNKKLMKSILINNLGYECADLKDPNTKQYKGSNNLFKMIFKNVGLNDKNIIDNAFEKIKAGRVEGAHKVTQPALQENNYIKQFIDDCENLLKAFKIIEKELVNISHK